MAGNRGSSSDASRVGRFVRPIPGLKDAIKDFTDIATAIEAIEKQSKHQEEEAGEQIYDSSVDDPNTYPVLFSITRHQSEHLERRIDSCILEKWSLPDLRKVQTTFNHISYLEGISDPDVIIGILQKYPGIDCLYMSPIRKPSDPNYSPYEMHLVGPGTVDILNCCEVTRKNVNRYIDGKEPRCLSLKRWSFEQRVMLKLRKIPFFKNFRLMKAFNGLAHCVDMSAFGKNSRKLRSQLLTCNQNYGETLLLVRTMCLDMAELSMIHVDAELTYILGEFMDDQEQYSIDVATKLERYLSILVHLISRTCWDDVISVGLAEEKKGRREGAPKRVNELRKMQRLRQGTSGAGSRLTADDVNIGSWITSSDPDQAQELFMRKSDKCNKLSRFIYLVDYLIVDTLYEIFAGSLKTSENYLSLQLETFPTDEGISAIVKGYVGDLDKLGIFSDHDDDDDGGGGGGGANSHRDPGTNTKNDKGNQNEKKDSEKAEDRARTTPPTGQGQGRPVLGRAASRSRHNGEMDASNAWTTVSISSSTDRNGTDTAGLATPSTTDNARYSPVHGEADISYSLGTTSSSLSEDAGNVNPLGTLETEGIQVGRMDDIHAPLLMGSENRTFRLYDESSSIIWLPGSSTEQETEMDDVTVVERQNQLDESDSSQPTANNRKRVSYQKQTYLDDTEEELTITSDDKGSPLNQRKNKQSNNVSPSMSKVSKNIYLLVKDDNKENKVNLYNDKLAPAIKYHDDASSNLAKVSMRASANRKEYAFDSARRKIDEALALLQQEGNNYDSDSSDSASTLPIKGSQPVKRTDSSDRSIQPEFQVNKIMKPLGKDERASSGEEGRGSRPDDALTEQDIKVFIMKREAKQEYTLPVTHTPACTFFYTTDSSSSENNEFSDSESYRSANTSTISKAAKLTKAQAFSSQPENIFRDSRISGIFSILNKKIHTLVNIDRENGGANTPYNQTVDWVTNYMNDKDSNGTSVDEFIVPNIEAASLVMNSTDAKEESNAQTSQVKAVNFKESNKAWSEARAAPLEREQMFHGDRKASDDESSTSFESIKDIKTLSASENGDLSKNTIDRNISQNKSSDEGKPDVKNTSGEVTPDERKNLTGRANRMSFQGSGNESLGLENSNPDRYTSFPGNFLPSLIIDEPTVLSNRIFDYYGNDEKVYMNANTSPSMEDEEDDDINNKMTIADFLMSENYKYLSNTGVTRRGDTHGLERGLSSSNDMLNNENVPGVRKDGGKRKKIGKTNQETVNNQPSSSTSAVNDENVKKSEYTDNGSISINTGQTRKSQDSSGKKFSGKTCSSKSGAHSRTPPPCVLSEESSHAKNLEELVKLLPEAMSTLLKIQASSLPKYEHDEYNRSTHGHNVHFNSKNSSFMKTESEYSMSLSESDVASVHALHPSPTTDHFEDKLKAIEETNDTENDLTDSVRESSNDENYDFVSFENIVEKIDKEKEKDDDVGGNYSKESGKNDDGVKVYRESKDDGAGRKGSDTHRNSGGSGGGGGGRGGGIVGVGVGGGGGGGSGGTSGITAEAKKWLTPDLKPMFHACLTNEREIFCITPDVYDFTASSFNVIHNMEMRLLSIDNLTSNPVFLTFIQPSADGHTSVDKKPKGPSLERVLRYDPNVTRLKNNIYTSIDHIFHSVSVYTKEMEHLYLKYFQKRHLDLDPDIKDVDFYCKYLQRYDAQIKIADRLPESQRLGLFLIDLTPYKEFVRQCSIGSLQQLQLELNADVVYRTRILIEKLNELHTILENKPTNLVPLFRRLVTIDSINELLQNLEMKDISHIAALYNVIDRFDVPHTVVDRRAFESIYYLVTSARHVGYTCRRERNEIFDSIDRCLNRDVRYLHVQVKTVVRPLVEAEFFLDGQSDPLQVRDCLMETEQVVRTHVAMANFVREVQRYLGRPDTHFTELFHLSSRYVNTRNLWLLMADWDHKLDKWKNQNFQTLDMQEINSYTFKYMDACDKLEKLLPKNTVLSVFEEKIDVMLRWLNFIIEFRGQAVKPRHWNQIEEVLGVEFGEDFPLTLASLMSINAIDKLKNLHVILNKARAESNVQNEFSEVSLQCKNLTLPVQTRQKVLVDGEEPVTVHLLGDTFEIEESLNYFVMELERIELSPHSGFLHNALEEFVQSIFEALEKMVLWMEMQMKLSRLRRLIVRHPELSESLPNEVAKYKEIFITYSQFMERVLPDPNVMKWCTAHMLHDIIEAQHEEILGLYRVFKRDIELRGGHENNQQDAQQQFGAWVAM